MAPSFSYFILSCFIILVFQRTVECNTINCYSCTVCGSTSSSWTQVSNTSTNINYCFKYTYSFSVISYVNRGATTTCQQGSDGLGGTWYCCLSDLCNRSISSHSYSLGLISALFLFKTIVNN